MRHLLIGVLGLVAVLGRSARADQSPEVNLTVVVPSGKTAPQIEVTVIGGPKLALDKYALTSTYEGKPVSVKPTKLRSYAEGNEPIAIAFVMNGQEIWVGNDDFERDGPARYTGALKSLVKALDKSKLRAMGPKGSKGLVITYSVGAELRLPTSDLGKLTGATLGTQKAYKGKLGTDMVSGLTLAIAELTKVSTARKALIVIGDGNDTNNEAAKAQLTDLKKLAATQGIQVFAIVYKSPLSADGDVITRLAPSAKTVSSVDGLAAELDAIVARLSDRYYLTFPGQGLPWDGKAHDVVLMLDKVAADPVTLSFAPTWLPTK
jgi:hypothetical protein